jgi:hypothetical protein
MKDFTLTETMNLVDVAVLKYGNIESLVQLCRDNALGTNSDPAAGGIMLIDESVGFKPTGKIYQAVPVIKTTEPVVFEKQGLIDLALQYTGGLDGLVALCQLNGLILNESPAPGTKIKVSTDLVVNKNVVSQLKKKGLCIGHDTDGDGIPADALLTEDSQPILTEDGNFILIE